MSSVWNKAPRNRLFILRPHLIRGCSNAAEEGGGDTLLEFLTSYRVCRVHPSRCCVDTPDELLNTFWGVKQNHQKCCQTPSDNTFRGGIIHHS